VRSRSGRGADKLAKKCGGKCGDGGSVETDGTFPVSSCPWGREPENDPAVPRVTGKDGWAGGPAFKLQKPPQPRVPRSSRTLRRAGTTTAYTTGSVERTRVAPAASPPTPSTSSGQALTKNARMGHPPWEWCNAKMSRPPFTSVTACLLTMEFISSACLFFVLSCKPISYCRFKRIDVYIL
jgi:hypothetical protein